MFAALLLWSSSWELFLLVVFVWWAVFIHGWAVVLWWAIRPVVLAFEAQVLVEMC